MAFPDGDHTMWGMGGLRTRSSDAYIPYIPIKGTITPNFGKPARLQHASSIDACASEHCSSRLPAP